MNVEWTTAALADVESVVPGRFRIPLLEFLRGLLFIGQGRLCTDPRYPNASFIKFQFWFVMFVPVGDDGIGVIAVEYNRGQEP